MRRMQRPPDPLPDNTPIELPLGARRPPTLQEQIARMVRAAVEAEQGEQYESWEESDDFEEENPDTLDFSKYELQMLHEENSIRDYGPEPDAQFGAESVGNPKTGDQPDQNAEEPS